VAGEAERYREITPADLSELVTRFLGESERAVVTVVPRPPRAAS